LLSVFEISLIESLLNALRAASADNVTMATDSRRSTSRTMQGGKGPQY